ncbi:hypothetical protein SEA_MAYA_48 [Streptomyces phage Maya]|uniref:Uncharacterized protein n=11 Tax=Rimavirus rima TaxID=2560784 RepID=A0A515MIR4_9CAUD|nr:hypothetical protein FDH06_gp49 [Streptomyces phage Rima]AOZ64913.1 hypothetical protein SEA_OLYMPICHELADO_48 [Streptomyces phage OlympicHelado]ASU04043.1 hypothetical protein SEA_SPECTROPATRONM_48 [Streptomyces phage Spectropatronm]QAY16347.1 hypothetical protein SEA_NAMO_49 [Streptomyces phage Namo]QDM56549.1 hypothetical protein SEA_ESKETIT_48 [Streptomyces phage Esketit]QEQ93994.1 hypothetical protein SEA_MEIBYSRARUS_46 [Streptomyces phage Meibysrarus]QEQ94264.1 hypothetical protein SE
MSNNKNAAKVTAESVAAQAAEENLVVPTQKNENSDKPVEVVEETTEVVELEVVEGDKKSFKERLVGVTEKLKENKKVVAGVAVSVALAAVAFAKFAAKQTTEETEETEEDVESQFVYDDELNPAVDPVTGEVVKDDESAA